MPPANPEYCFLWIDHWSTCMQKGEWSSWVQAIFSVIAICAAIGIAMWQRRVERVSTAQIELARAEIVSSKVLYMTANLPGVLRRLASDLRAVPSSDDPRALLTELQREFDFIQLPGEAQLMSLLPVPHNAARRLTTACELVDQSKHTITKLDRIGEWNNLREMTEEFLTIGGVVEKTVLEFDRVFADLRTFLNSRNAMHEVRIR